MKVFIFGGTTEGRVLARTLSEAGYDITVSVATEIGKEELLRDLAKTEDFLSADLRSEYRTFRILTGRMDSEEMQKKISGFDICIDATHPYAVEVTSNIKKACETAGVEYVRLLRDAESISPTPHVESSRADSHMESISPTPHVESSRPDLYAETGNSIPCTESSIPGTAGNLRTVTEVPSARAACHLLLETEGNILLTTGSKELGTFAEIPRERLYVRVLPTQASLAACEEAGIPHRNIIAMFGPFTQKMNEAILEQYHIAHLVTKEAGKNGGFEEKLRAAGNCGVGTIVIRRPEESGMSMAEVIDLIDCKAGQKQA